MGMVKPSGLLPWSLTSTQCRKVWALLRDMGLAHDMFASYTNLTAISTLHGIAASIQVNFTLDRQIGVPVDVEAGGSNRGIHNDPYKSDSYITTILKYRERFSFPRYAQAGDYFSSLDMCKT